jgi:LCP family protein required for cell wall assembly
MADRGRHFAALKRGNRRWYQRMVLGLAVLITFGTFTGAGLVVWVYAKVGELVRFSEDEVNVQEAAPEEPANFLIVGSDSRENVSPDDPTFADDAGSVGGQRSDTIMLARIDPEDTQIQIVSFPRDLWLPLASGQTQRINAAYGQGRQVLIDTIQQNFGITINHYIEIDFTGFRRLVDAIDGVPVYLDSSYRDERANLAAPIGPGCVTLNGEQALGFSRARHLQKLDEDGDWITDPTGDLGRITRQQFFIRKALEQVLSLNPFTNPLKFAELLDVAVDSVGVDNGLSNDDLRNLGSRFRGFDPETILNYALPVTNYRTNGGAAVLLLEDDEAEPIFNIFRGLDPGDVVPSQVTVRVRNGSGADRQGANTADALAAVGFDASVDGDAEPTTETTVYYSPGAEASAQLVARHLTSKAAFVEDPSLEGEVLLVTGTDFTTVVRQPWSEEAVPAPTTTTTTSTTVTGGTGRESTTTVPETTTTTAIGFLPEAPPGTEC